MLAGMAGVQREADAAVAPDCVSVMHFHYCARCVREEWETVGGLLELGWRSVEEAEAALGTSWICPFCRTVSDSVADDPGLML